MKLRRQEGRLKTEERVGKTFCECEVWGAKRDCGILHVLVVCISRGVYQQRCVSALEQRGGCDFCLRTCYEGCV